MRNILFILLFCPLFTLSQDTIKIPTRAAKSIVKDLVSCDSLKAIHKLTVNELDLTKEKVNIQFNIIKSHEEKGIMYEQRITNEQEKFKVQGQWLDDLRKQNKKLKIKIKFIQIAGAVVGGILTYLYITK